MIVALNPLLINPNSFTGFTEIKRRKCREVFLFAIDLLHGVLSVFWVNTFV